MAFGRKAARLNGHGRAAMEGLQAQTPRAAHLLAEIEQAVEPPAGLTRMDGHCHSHASSGAALTALGWINCPECYTPPEKVYEQAMARGMDLVTITDHDTIDGAMELVERGFDRFVVGEEVSVRFPEDRCMLHVLVYCLTPELHEEIAKEDLREDIYKFAAWLKDRDLPHAVAHPLYIQNGKLQRWHVERASLLFRGFECLNGAHAVQVSHAAVRYLDRLTPRTIERLSREHAIEPLWPEPWVKARTGGSDDHGLLNIGRTWTQIVPEDGQKITDAEAFVRLAMEGKSEQYGIGGHSALLAHQLATVGAHYYAERFFSARSTGGRYMAGKLLKFAGVSVPLPSKKRVAASKAARKVMMGKTGRKKSLPLVRALKKRIKPVLEQYPDIAERLDPEKWIDGAPVAEHERMADFIQDLSRALSEQMSPGARKAIRKRDPHGLVDHLISYAMLHAAQAPYLISLFYQNKERNFLDRFEHETSAPGTGVSVLERPVKVSLFTDTIADVNGVCRFIQNVAERGLESGRDLQVITSTSKAAPEAANIHNFKPVFSTSLPKYDNLDICLPPVLRILRHVDQHQPDVIHISTPGPVGLIGFLAAKILRIPVLGVYHTDFPAYIDQLFDDPAMTKICQRFMKGFYTPFSSVFTRSEDYVDALTGLGLPRDKMVSLMPGFENHKFHPHYRDPSIWEDMSVPADRVKVLYVGRISVEKNMPALVEFWKKTRKLLEQSGRKDAAQLVLVGDGPYREKMTKALGGALGLGKDDFSFLGFRHGEELSRIYASSDFFVFPSVTDTLGQVVMESQGSGLPVIVTDKGGPKEVVRDGETGFVIDSEDADGWAARIVDLVLDESRRREMGAAAHESMQTYSLANSFEHFWQVHVDAWHDHLREQGITMKTAGMAQPAAGPTESEAPGAYGDGEPASRLLEAKNGVHEA